MNVPARPCERAVKVRHPLEPLLGPPSKLVRNTKIAFAPLALTAFCTPWAVAETPTAITLTSATSPSTALQNVTFTANIVYDTVGSSNTGSVTFYDGATPLATIDFSSGQSSHRLFDAQTGSLSQPIHGGFSERTAALLQIPASQQSQNNIGSAALPDLFSCNDAAACSTSALYPYQVGKYPLTYPLGIASNSTTLLVLGYNDLSLASGNPGPAQLDYFHGGYLAWLLMFGTPDANKLSAAKNCVATGNWTAAPASFPPGSLFSNTRGSTLTCTSLNATDAGVIAVKSTTSSATFTVAIANAGSTQTLVDSYTQSSVFNQTAAYNSAWGGTSNLYAAGQPNLSGGATNVTYTCVAASAADPCVVVAPYFLSNANGLQNTPIVQSMLVGFDCGNGSCGVAGHTDAATNQMRAEQIKADSEMLANGVNVVYIDPNQSPGGFNPNLAEQTSQVVQYVVQAGGSGYSSGAMTFNGCEVNATATAPLGGGAITPGTYYTTTAGACAGGTPRIQFTGGGSGAVATASAVADGTHPNTIGATSIATIAAAQLNAAIATTGANTFTVSYTTNVLSSGSHQITAKVNPLAGYTPSSASLTQIVSADPTAITLNATPATIVFGAPVTLTAAVANTAGAVPTGAITFLDGASNLSTVPMTNGAASYTATSLSGGAHSITAVYSGDANYLAPTSAAANISVNRANAIPTLAASALTSTYGAPVRFVATMPNTAAAAATGAVTLMYGGQALGYGTLAAGVASFSNSTLNVGVYSIAAAYSGDTNFSASTSAPLTLTITQATPTITWPASSAIPYGAALSTAQLNATASTAGTFAYSPNAGTVLGAGSQTLSATFTPTDTTDYAAPPASTVPLTVNKAPLAISANNTARVFGAANPAFSGTIAGAVNGDTFTESFATTASPASIVGSYPIAPSVAGPNLADYAVIPTNGALTISQAGTATTFALSNSSLTLTATVLSLTSGTPTGAVGFYEGQTLVGTGTLNSGTASFTTTTFPAGNVVVSAQYSGDANFTPSASPTIFVVAIIPVQPSITAPAAGTASDSLTIAAVAGFTGTLQFSCTGLPQFAICTFQPASVTFPSAGNSATTAVTIQTGASASATTPALFPRSLTALAELFWLPALLLAGLARRLRKLHPRAHLLRLVLLLAGICTALTACGSSPSPPTTPAGTSTVQIVATGPSGFSQTTSLSLTVQ